MKYEIYIIDDDKEVMKNLENSFKDEKDFIFKSVSTKKINEALNSIPSLIIINEESIGRKVIDVANAIRCNEDNSITPILVLTNSKNKKHRIDILKTEVEFTIKKPIDNDYLYFTIKNLIRLLSKNRGVSPLTGLPGNIQIQAEIKKRILNKENFIVMYFDLDNFKAYNDTYGFLAGDEIIKQTARSIVDNINNKVQNHSFIGHIGGDDFVAIIDSENYEEICQDIIIEFDKVVLDYYTKEDRERGYLKVPNRRNVMEEIPLVSISIGVVVAYNDRFNNALEIGEVGAQVKHLAKLTQGSAYAINRRKKIE
jgi:diguanylate cyclase (GGDEF)-like protein